MSQENSPKLAIRFGLGAIKAVGLGMTEIAVKERQANGKFSDIYDFAERLDPRSVNKKSVEALAKAGAFDNLVGVNKRSQISESFDVLSAYSSQKNEAANSNQMSLFGGVIEDVRPELKKVSEWVKAERLQKEFEAFGFFLNEHPIDDHVSALKKRGVIFSDKIEKDELSDNDLVKMAGAVAGSKHRSSARGRFAYLTISDHLGIFEAMIFDEALITSARDILVDGSVIYLECLIKKDEGGVRILVRDVKKLEDFIKNTRAAEVDFEDITKQPARRNYNSERRGEDFKRDGSSNKNWQQNQNKEKSSEQYHQEKLDQLKTKKVVSMVQIVIKDRDPIIMIKSFLSQKIAPSGFDKVSKVSFCVMRSGKIYKVELAEKYLLDDADIAKLKKVEKVVDVEYVA